MTGAEIVRRVELPLALPLVVAGIRTSAVNVIATATLAPVGGRRDARRPHHQPDGLRRRRPARRRPCSSPSSRSAAEVGLGAVQRAVTPKRHSARRPGAGGCSSPGCRQPRGGHNRHDHPTRTIPAGIPAPPGSARAAAARRGRSCGLRQRRQQRQLRRARRRRRRRARRARSSRPTAPTARRRSSSARRTSPSRRSSARSTPRPSRPPATRSARSSTSATSRPP